MIYYIVPFLLWTIYCAWKAGGARKELSLLDYFVAVPLLLLPVLRGDVGTDTINYLVQAEAAIEWNGRSMVDVEFGYSLLVRLLAVFTDSPRLIVALVSLLAAVLLLWMLYQWEERQCAVSLVILASSYYPFTMNVLRVGIAFALAGIAVLKLEKRQVGRFILLSLAAVSFQLTSIVLLPLLYLARRGCKISPKVLLGAAALGIVFPYFLWQYFAAMVAYKLILYSAAPATESGSGAFPLLLSLLCAVLAMWFTNKERRYWGFIFFLMVYACFRLAAVSYAGLRLETMVLFAQFLALSTWAKRPLTSARFAAVLLLACLAFIGAARNFMATAGQESAFIPYYFAWESR